MLLDPTAICIKGNQSWDKGQRSILSFVNRPDVATRETVAQNFSKSVDQLLSMEEPAVLCIQSPMGTGKTCLLKLLIRELELRVGRPVQVCIVTYRTALALNMMAALEDLGFINSLDEKGTNKLQLADKCIVQLDSIGRVMRNGHVLPHHDLVDLDESESSLHTPPPERTEEGSGRPLTPSVALSSMQTACW